MRISAAFFIGLIAAVVTTAKASEYRQSVGVGVLDVFNVGVSASVIAAGDPSTAAKTNRDYLDGYNRVDSSGNLGEGAPGLPSRTSNFGFTSDSQVNLQAGTLSLHTTTPADTAYVNKSSVHGRAGGELTYQIVRERADSPWFGLEARAGYVDVDYSSSQTLSTSVRLLTDAYQLGGVVPQPAPYSGSFTVQPGTQRIGDIPTRSVSTVAATAQGNREFTAKGWLLRVGAVWEPVHSSRVAAQIHAGPALLGAKGTFRLNDKWIAPGQPTLTQVANGQRTKSLFGFYAGATARVRLNDNWDIFAGGDYLDVGSFKVSAPTAFAKFNFSHSVLATAGISFRF